MSNKEEIRTQIDLVKETFSVKASGFFRWDVEGHYG